MKMADLKVLTGLQVSGSLNTSGSLTVGGNGTLTANTVDINGGSIDGVSIATSNITVGAGKTLNVSAGTLTLAAGQVAADKVGAGTFNSGTFSFNGSTISDLGAVTTADINGGTIDGVSIGATTQAAGKFTSISGSSTLQVGGVTTLNGDLTVNSTTTLNGDVTFGGNIVADANENKSIFTGVTSNTITIGAAGATVSIPGTASVGGNLSITGDLTVYGATTTVASQNVTIKDKNVILGVPDGGAAATDIGADGGGITLSGSTNKTFQWSNSTDSWTSSEHIDLASGKEFKINNSSVLSSTTLGSTVVNSSLTSLGNLTGLTVEGTSTLSGAVLILSDTDFGAGTGYLNLTGVLSNLANALPQETPLSINKYYSVRSSMKGASSGGVVTFLLSGSGNDTNSWSTANVTGALPAQLTASAVEGPSELLNRMFGASIDVAVRNGPNQTWTNDLVSVNVSASLIDDVWYPLITVEAPALPDNNQIRLIVVNDTNYILQG
jgi:hypothetical protein